jgi:hypothetical protein
MFYPVKSWTLRVVYTFLRKLAYYRRGERREAISRLLTWGLLSLGSPRDMRR